ncbi:glycosyltransferase [Oscillibacter sp.]|uniref:glycosyltransferase n=1 Tax=Oscillibacter sp. TaxID=1945593 RepID=UPI0028A13961|nr:glycosyltransferase [Oscillibacter sp.]
MNGCMETDLPQIAILMAVYEPRLDWLRAQLLSLNAQTYPKLRLYIREDGSPTVPFETISACVAECIRAFPYTLERNEKNLGSNLTFQRLTEEAEGAYFAYCDQDDVWLPEKLTVLQEALERENALLVCSDMSVIDGDGALTAHSITQVRRHHVFRSGEDLAQGLLTHNFVSGCAMLVPSEAAKAAVPFCPDMVHDHYLALWCAERGRLVSLSRPLLQYRIHGGNQTGILSGVTDKASYGRVRIDGALDKLRWLSAHFPCREETRRVIAEQTLWLEARRRWWNHQGGGATVWKYRRFSPLPSMAELALRFAPEWIFRKAVALARRNRV